jgi:hypothetical protein
MRQTKNGPRHPQPSIVFIGARGGYSKYVESACRQSFGADWCRLRRQLTQTGCEITTHMMLIKHRKSYLW